MRSCSPLSSIVIVENGASGLRRKMRATSLAGGSPSGQTLSIVMKRSALGDRRPWRAKSSNSVDWREMWLIIRSRSDVLMLGKALDISPGAESRVDPRVGNRCKSAISRRRERAAGCGLPTKRPSRGPRRRSSRAARSPPSEFGYVINWGAIRTRSLSAVPDTSDQSGGTTRTATVNKVARASPMPPIRLLM